MIRSAAARPFSVFAVTATTAFCVLAWPGGTHAQAPYAVLHTFTDPDGLDPSDGLGLIQGPDGTLYGTTLIGGAGRGGTVFQMAPDGSGFALLHTFTGGTDDGANPEGGLLQGPDGTLYGTTTGGGDANRGTVYQVAPDGSGYALLHSFTGPDGASPLSNVIQGPDGTLYGTTRFGGAANGGTVFQMAPDGSGFALLHCFSGSDGNDLRAGLIQAADGTLYGTTVGGGDAGRGTVFQMAPDGSGFTLLHSFTGGTVDGAIPQGGLLQGPDGTLYGTTFRGGDANLGTVYQMAPDGSGFALLYSFTGPDGASPLSNVIQGPDGTLYGTTLFGGALGGGTVFRMAPDGSGFTLLHCFPPTTVQPTAGLIQGLDGTLYGTTSGFEILAGGVVFSLSPGAAAFPATLASPTSITRTIPTLVRHGG
jgi:uncharacterized repeat protein (TIGR03803 family)